MKKMNEMDRSIYLRSVAWAYRAVALGLCVWTLYNSYQTFAHGAAYVPLPALILCLGGSVQGFSSLAMKQKMAAGDEEFHEPNKFLRAVLSTVIGAALLLSVGAWLLLKA